MTQHQQDARQQGDESGRRKRLPAGALWLLAAVALVLTGAVLVTALKSLRQTMPLPVAGDLSQERSVAKAR